jgi:DNA-binding transcriptional ArsR family regulator
MRASETPAIDARTLGDADISAVAALIAEPTRAAMLEALLDGNSRRAGELARRAGVAPSTASEHLARLLAGRLVVCEAEGRERRYRLASRHVAEALEAFAQLAPPAEVRSLRAADRAAALRTARTCYDHLAGRLGVGLTESFVRRGVLVARDSSFEVTKRGEATLAALGVDVAAARAQRRSFGRACLDWSERRPHLAGGVGAALCTHSFANDWIRRLPGTRAVAVTPKGQRVFRERFGAQLT